MQKATLLAGLRLQPGDTKFLEALGSLLEQQEAWEELIEHFLAQRSAVPGGSVLDGYLHFMLGKAATALGRNEQGVSWLNQAIAVRPDFPFAHHLLAQIRRRLGQLPEALEASQRCCSLAPDFPWGWLETGEIQLQLGQPEAALASLERGRQRIQGAGAEQREIFEQAMNRARTARRDLELRELARLHWPDRADAGGDLPLDPIDALELEILHFRRLLDRFETPPSAEGS